MCIRDRPYIDVRTDFNSFLPSGLPAKLEKKIINYYITQIKKKPSNHDKIEFNLVETCYDLNTKKNLKKFLNSKETKIYSEKLKIITNKIILINIIIIVMRKLILTISLTFLFFLIGCASHPVVHPGTLKKNEQVWGYALAAENVLPVVWFRKGLDQNTEIGYRIGLPIYGTGIDLSRTVMRRENAWDLSLIHISEPTRPY